MLTDAPHDARPADALAAAIADKRAIIGVIGLGYVGLPLALAAAARGFRVLGLDLDATRVAALARGESYIGHIASEEVAAPVRAGRFEATADLARLAEPDALLICVPTPLTLAREPDLSFVEATAGAIARTLRSGQIVVLESTTYPGTTREVLKPRLEASGLTSRRDFFLAFSPEREDPGRGHAAGSIPKVVGGDGPVAQRLAGLLYQALGLRTVPVSTMDTAEAVKLTENIFRAVNIALVNELKTVYAAMGIDIWEVIDAAKTKPFGFMPFYPGPGFGGHCIPVDPLYLTWKAREFGVATRFIELAGEINAGMPAYVVGKLAQALDAQRGRALAGARLLVIGVAYKKGVDDVRESPALKLIDLLEARGAIPVYHDPLVPILPATREHPALAGRRSVPLDAETLAEVDAALIVTDHDGIDWGLVVKHARLVIDTRDACARAGATGAHIVKA